MEFHIRRVQRADFAAIRAVVTAGDLPVPPPDRAVLHRFRNIVGDLGCDFDVAAARDRVRGFVHLTYSRDLLSGNRAHLLALVADAVEVRDALLERTITRARRRHCRDLTATAGPWLQAFAVAGIGARATRVDGVFRIDLTSEPEQSDALDRLPAAYRLPER